VRDRLNIIGSGRVGTTLGLLFRHHGFEIGDISNRSNAASERAIETLGAGRAVTELSALRPAPLTMITTSDDAIAPVAEALAQSGVMRPGDIAFHCSGATSCEALAPLRECGAQIASVHPLQTFTDPVLDAQTFPNTFCAIDGDAEAAEALDQIFARLGGNCARIPSESKLLYHAGAVFMSNYLMALMDAALSAYEAAGLDRATARKAMRPLAEASMRNALDKGPIEALTGPIARGDTGLITRQRDALREADTDLAALYETLGQKTVALREARDNPPLAPQILQEMRKILGES